MLSLLSVTKMLTLMQQVLGRYSVREDGNSLSP